MLSARFPLVVPFGQRMRSSQPHTSSRLGCQSVDGDSLAIVTCSSAARTVSRGAPLAATLRAVDTSSPKAVANPPTGSSKRTKSGSLSPTEYCSSSTICKVRMLTSAAVTNVVDAMGPAAINSSLSISAISFVAYSTASVEDKTKS